MRYVVGLSGGKDSTALALRLAEVEPEKDWEYICTPTGDELPPMLDHWARLEEMLGKPLIRITNKGRTLDDLIQIHNAVPNFRMRWCTRQLKIEPTIAWCVRNAPVLMHVGLRADESEREGIYGDLVTSRFPFREWGWGIGQVTGYLEDRGIEIPERTDCAKCYHQRIGEWFNLWRDYPERFFAAAEQEARIGHTFRSPGRDTWPVALIDLAEAFASGRRHGTRTPPDGPQQKELFCHEMSRGKCRPCSL
jgi:hypothetical protein